MQHLSYSMLVAAAKPHYFCCNFCIWNP